MVKPSLFDDMITPSGACLALATRIPRHYRHVREQGLNMNTSLKHSPANATDGYKQQAKRLRALLKEQGRDISHGEALEMVARQHGFRDWNTLAAAAPEKPAPPRNAAPPVSVGSLVGGRYLNQPFVGEVLSVTALADGEHFRISIHFAEPVDVVSFESFSAFRRRVVATINRDGVSPQRTSNGLPQMVIDR